VSPRRSSLVAAIATIIAIDVAIGLTFPLLPLILAARGVDATTIGFNAAMSPLGIVLVGPFIPALAARLGAKRLAVAAMALTVLSLAGFPLTDNLAAWFALRFLLGLAGGVLYSLSEAWIMHFAEDASRGRVTAVYASLLSLGFSLGSFIIPFTGIEGARPFAIAIAMVLLGTLPFLFIALDDSEFAEVRKGDGFFGFVARAPLLLLAVGTLTLFDAVMLAFLPIYGLRHGLSLQEATWALGLAIAGNAVLQYPVGWIADRWSRVGVLTAAAALTVVLALLLPVAVTTWAIWPVALLIGSSAYAIYTVALAILGDEFRGAALVAGSAAFGAMWGVGGIVGPPVAGRALESLGPDGIPWFLALCYGLLLGGLALSRGQLVRQRAHG
jgi:MFS family permease